MHLAPKVILMLSGPPLMWACNAVLGRMTVGSIDPLWLNALRWLLAFALLLPLGWAAVGTRQARAEILLRWRYLAVIGLIGIGGFNALQYMALQTSTPLNVTLIASSSPVWTLLIGAVLYGIRPSRLQMLGAVLSLAGVALVLSRGEPAALLDIRLVRGDLYILLAIMGWSLYTWMLARPPAHMSGAQRPDWNWAEFLVAQCVFGICGAVGAAVVGDVVAPSAPTQWSWFLVFTVLFVAIGPSIIAYRLWGLAVQEAGPAMAAIFYNLTPLFAALLSAALIGEWPQPFHAIAFALIVAGILVSSRGAKATG